MRRLHIMLGIGALVAGSVTVCLAGVTLHAGDIVLVDSFVLPHDSPGLWRLDAASLDTTRIAAGGLLVEPDRLAVDGSGIVYVADHVSGVVRIDAATGAQSVLVAPSALGGMVAYGVCLAQDGTLYVTTIGPSTGAVLSVNRQTGDASVLSQGGLLAMPSCIAAGPDGALYVGDQTANTITGSVGSIVRIETSGSQTVFANGTPFARPFDLAISDDGWIWSAQWGLTQGRSGARFVRTRLTDGTSEPLGGELPQGVASTKGGEVFLGECSGVSRDCFGDTHIRRASDGAQRSLPAGGMGVVPASATPARRSTWGALKTIYR